MVKEFNSLEEIQKYYDEKTNTYIFKEDKKYIDSIKFNFCLNVKSNIKCRNISGIDVTAYDINAFSINVQNIDAWNVNASDINALDIKACDIKADYIRARDISTWNINAYSISYFAVCFAYKNIKCKSINGRRENSKHFVLDGVLDVEK